jgi:ubiquinone/menaquinone biosynthesis C-methylase UbiE
MAVEYAADNADSAFNAYYERPATISLLGEVEGRHVLEVGCGAGPLTAWMVERGAAVTAMDVSPAMLQLAKERVGDRATFLVADLAEPLSFAGDATFDLVVASLVLHYVRDWEAPLREFRRALKPDGAVVLSTHHPAMDWQLHCPDDYFAVKQVTETWSKGSRDFEVTFWRRPLTAMAEAIAAAGFVTERLLEPEPSPQLRHRDGEAFDLLRTKPQFLFFRLRSG